jgi:hypothetical protein
MALTSPVQVSFRCGQLVLVQKSRNVLQRYSTQARTYFQRHLNGDWGDVSPARWRANDCALRDGETLRSSYELSPVWALEIVTEWDRSTTTLSIVPLH